QRKVRQAQADQVERTRNIGGGPRLLHTETKNCILKIERNEWIVLDDQHVVGKAGHQRERGSKGGSRDRDGPLPTPPCKRVDGFPTQSSIFDAPLSVHLSTFDRNPTAFLRFNRTARNDPCSPDATSRPRSTGPTITCCAASTGRISR